jgi:Tol biopolymer transport system component
MVWVTRNGTEQLLSAPARNYDQPRLSPDGRRVAVDIREKYSSQVGVYDTTRDTLTRLTFEGTINEYPVWTPDGRRIVFQSSRDGGGNLFWQMADGSGGIDRLTNTTDGEVPMSYPSDGQTLAVVDLHSTGFAISTLRTSDRKMQPFLDSPGYRDAPQFSPDGHWLAYVSDETGHKEIYVQPYPGPGGKWQISTDGGSEPMWNPNGRELFYRSGNNDEKLMAVDISTQSGFAPGKPHQLFQGNYLPDPYARANYDVSPDGQRFLMLKPIGQSEAAPTQIDVVLNWTEELKRLVPMGK